MAVNQRLARVSGKAFVILATDGDWNVGITNQDELKGYIERERGKGVFLSVLGFGMGMEFPVAQSMVSELMPADKRGRYVITGWNVRAN